MSAVHLQHPVEFTDGTRVLLLKARHKDGTVGKERAIQRATHSTAEFQAKLTELREMLRPGERIYSTVNPRCLKKAARMFGERMNDALHDPEPVKENFFQNLPNRWYSCLMKPETALSGSRLWMWDCDTPEHHMLVRSFVLRSITDGKIDKFYEYPTKSGYHVIVTPYDRSITPKEIGYPEMNPLMLWSYYAESVPQS